MFQQDNAHIFSDRAEKSFLHDNFLGFLLSMAKCFCVLVFDASYFFTSSYVVLSWDLVEL